MYLFKSELLQNSEPPASQVYGFCPVFVQIFFFKVEFSHNVIIIQFLLTVSLQFYTSVLSLKSVYFINVNLLKILIYKYLKKTPFSFKSLTVTI